MPDVLFNRSVCTRMPIKLVYFAMLLSLVLVTSSSIAAEPGRVTLDLVAEYNFLEGSGSTVNDVSGVAPALNLTIDNAANTQWLECGGLSVNNIALVSSGEPATKIIDGVKASEALTVEAWITPTSTSQSGPARIVTLSDGGYKRNLTLGQNKGVYQTRLRTTTAGDNGTSPYVQTPSNIAMSLVDPTHVVYTRDANGIAITYINGVASVTKTVDGSVSNWDDTMQFALANELGSDRHWLGKLFHVAVYDRALSVAEVTQNMNVGVVGTCGQAPSAIFSFTKVTGGVEYTVDFDASASYDADGSIVSYDWDFGDDVIASGINASHVYANAGQYTVTLVTTDDQGKTDQISQMVAVFASGRVVQDQVLFYNFSEGEGTTVNDLSGVDTPVNLTIPDASKISWLSCGGLSIDQSTFVSAASSPLKLIDAVQASNELTIEAWVTPENTTQSGPARIVTYSIDGSNRNFTLGQDASNYDVRFRTGETNDNGMSPNLEATGQDVAMALSHVVYTRNQAGEAKLYVDGVLVQTTQIEGVINNWDNSYVFGLGNEVNTNREWLGEYHLVAIFSRALSSAEVTHQFSVGVAGTCSANNAAPVINSTPVTSGSEGNPYSYQMMASDVDGDALTYTRVTGPTELTIDSNTGLVSWTPDYNAAGNYSVVLSVDDGTAALVTQSYTLVVSNVNQVPVVSPQTLAVNEGGSLSVTLTGVDADGDALTYSVITSPTNGALTGTAPNLTYTPTANFNGSDAFTYKVNDGQVDSNVATITINIAAVNNAPVINSTPVTSGSEGNPYSYQVMASDADGNALTYTRVTGPTELTIDSNTGLVSWTPDYNTAGDYNIVLSVDDGTAAPVTQSYTLVVSNVNQVPVASPQTLAVDEGGALSFTLTGVDADGDALTYSVIASPNNGALTGTAPNLTYTPTANFNGSDAFTYKVNDGQVDSNVVTITINIAAVNNAPVINSTPITSGSEGNPYSYQVMASDADGNALTYTRVTGPTELTIDSNTGLVSWTPDYNSAGNYNIVLSVDDGTAALVTQSYTLVVSNVNQVPVASPQILAVNEGESLAFTLTGVDADGDALTYSVITSPTNGALTGTAPNLTYTPMANFNGSDAFTYKVNDGQVDSNSVTVAINVAAENTSPQRITDDIIVEYDFMEGSGSTITDVSGVGVPIDLTIPDVTKVSWLSCGGLAIDESTFISASVAPTKLFDTIQSNNEVTIEAWINPGNLTQSGPGRIVTYSKDKYNRNFTFGQEANNYDVRFRTSETSDNGISPNLETTGQDVTMALSHVVYTRNQAGEAKLYVDGVLIKTTQIGGMISNWDSSYVFGLGNEVNTNRQWLGEYHLIAIFSRALSSEEITHQFSVGVAGKCSANNIAPVINSAPVTLGSEGNLYSYQMMATDADGNALTYTRVTGPTELTIDSNTGLVSWTPDYDSAGNYNIVLSVDDGGSIPVTQSYTLVVSNVNQVPEASPQTLAVIEGGSLAFTLAGVDADGDALTYNVITSPNNGALTGTAPNLTYTPTFNFIGSDAFTYKVNDGQVDSSVATVTINITAVNNAPVINSTPVISGSEGNPYSYQVMAFDADGNALTYARVTGPAELTIDSSTGLVSWTPDYDAAGNHNIVLSVDDGDAAPVTQSYTLVVSDVNQMPVASPQTLAVNEGESLSFILTGVDADGDALTYSVITSPTNGALIGTAPNLTYTPNDQFLGVDSLTFYANDGAGNSNLATITLNVSIKQVDSTAPVITIIGDNPLTVIDSYNPRAPFSFGATAFDAVDGVVAVGTLDYSATPAPDFSTVGTYQVTYTAQDKAGNVSEAIQTINVIERDLADPIVYIKAGVNPLLVPLGGVSPDLDDDDDVRGYSSSSASPDTLIPTTRSGNVDVGTVGHYPITYTVNHHGETASATRTIIVFQPNQSSPSTDYIISQTGDQSAFQFFDDGYYQAGRERNYSRDDAASTVVDNMTGLIWQDTAHVSTTEMTFYEGRNYCRDLTIDGRNWDLPTRLELLYLMDFNRTGKSADDPRLDMALFNHPQTSEWWTSYWTSDYQIYVYSQTGGVGKITADGTSRYVRCVSGVSPYKSPLLIHASKNDPVVYDVVHDTDFKLMWQDSVDVETNRMVWANAIHYCENLELEGFSDWHLPNINEGHTIVKHITKYNSVFQHLHTKVNGDPYWWTASSIPSDVTEAWSLLSYYAGFGGVQDQSDEDKDKYHYVRCVRNYKEMVAVIPEGDQTIEFGEMVSFTSNGSFNPVGDIESYKWRDYVNGQYKYSTSPNLSSSDFSVGLHEIKLTIIDRLGMEESTTVMLTVEAVNQIPIAEAGLDQSVLFGAELSLDGNSSIDNDGTIVSFEWAEGETVLSNSPDFTINSLAIGVHTLTLTVIDDMGGVGVDSVEITITEPQNSPPVAEAGDNQTLILGSTVNLNASGSSDSDGNIESYEWKEAALILSTDASFNINNLALGVHTYTLTVTDNNGATAIDSVVITIVEPPNQAPIANAGSDQAHVEGTLVMLSGSASSDPDGGALSYAWTEGPALLSTAVSISTNSFTVGEHIINLTVTDPAGASDTDTVLLTITQIDEYEMQICPIKIIEDDSKFVDSYPEDDIAWDGSNYSDVQEIEAAFNHARSIDSSVFEYLALPSQTEWDGMSAQAQGLYLVNSERQARGIKPFEGTSQNVIDVAQAYSDYIRSNDLIIDHYYNGTVESRLDSDPEIQDNNDKIVGPENIHSQHYVGFNPTASESVVGAIYGWLYEDKNPLSGQSWGHRGLILVSGLNENYGNIDKEGLLGFGVSIGDYDPGLTGTGSTGVVVVYNTIDPSSTWGGGITETVNIDMAQLCNYNNVIDIDGASIPDIINLESLKLSPSDILLASGETTTLSLTGIYQDGSEYDLTNEAHFIADTHSVVSINAGVVSGLLTGHTNMVAQVNDITSNIILINVDELVDTSNLIGSSVEGYASYIPTNTTINHYDPKAFSLYTGVVNDRYDVPIEGVTISVLNAKEYGSVETDGQGRFILPVGSGTQTLIYRKQDYLTVHRAKASASSAWAVMNDVIMLEADSLQTDIDLSTGATQIHTSSVITDQSGTRSATLVFSGVTSATVTLPDGTQRVLEQITVRATEYEFPSSMPADLPEETAFTYCTEREIVGVRDDAEVVFNNDVVMYVDNFLDFPVGEIIPVGYYDRQQGSWQGEDNGIVVKLLDVDSDGSVDGLDFTGDDIADDINGNGNTLDEVAGIESFEVGKTYWRGSSNHFSPGDYNLSSILPSDANNPDVATPVFSAEDENDNELVCTASYVKPMQQSFHEDISITGTGLDLHYSSQRVEGYKHKITAQVSGDEISSSMIEMIARLEIGGQVYEQSFGPEANKEVEFIWDGNDPEGKRLPGMVKGQISIGYKYFADYTSVGNVASSGTPFNDFGIAWAVVGGNSTGITGRQDLISWDRHTVSVQNSFDSHLANGWSISNYHELSPNGDVYKGDGNVINQYYVSRILKTGFNVSQYIGDDGHYQKGGSSINYSVGIDGALKDHVTGLEWQYILQPKKFRTKSEAETYCENNATPLNSGWRLPTKKEQVYSIDKASDLHDFPVYRFAALRYWSEITYNPDSKLIPTVCVRGETIDTLYVENLKRNNVDEVVVDGDNGLMWQDDSSVMSIELDWETSIDHCEGSEHAGYDNWRLPNINELAYVLPNDVFVNQATYPGTVWTSSNPDVNPYWSSTPNYQYEGEAWAMQSSSASSYRFDKTAAYPVRCVRDDNTALGGAYQFDQDGKHIATIDINTGNTLLTFNHNDDGLLSTIIDQFGDTITLNRDLDGKVTTILSPDGYVTELDIGVSNNLDRVDYDNSTNYQFIYENALMTLETDRKGNEFIHKFDANGRAYQTEDPEGGIWDFLQASNGQGGSDYGYTTAEDNAYSSSRTVLQNGNIQTSTTDKDGLQTITTRQADNLQETVQSCGVTTVTDRVIDPKTHNEIPSFITTTLPSSLSQSVEISLTYGENGADTTKQTLTLVQNEKTRTVYTNYLSGERTTTSPENRTVTTQTDPLTGLLQSVQTPGLFATNYTYDSRGRIETETTGTRIKTYHYNDAVSKGRVTSIEAADGKHTYFTYDDIGRTDVVTYSDDHITDTDLDNNGNASNVNVPSTGDYGFTHNSVDNVTSESSPLAEATGFIYDKDRNLTHTTFPSMDVMINTYVDGLLDNTARPEGTTNYAYGSCGAQIDTVTEETESITYAYDGKLLTGVSYQGELDEAITQGYNTDFLLNSLIYAGSSTVIGYDNDGHMTDIHGYTIGLKPDNALPDTLSDNAFVQSRGYNGYGEVDAVSTQVKNQSTYNYSLIYNDLGQITNKQETLHNGTVNNYVYTYHPDRRWLTNVAKNGTEVESYSYDANGNRELYSNTELSIEGKVPTYNIADQLTSDGHIYDVDGYLTQKTINSITTQYQYSSRGQLLSVQAPSLNITYQHNAMGNRVAKLVDNQIIEKYLWQDKTTLLAVYHSDGSLKQRFEYTLGNTPTSFIQAGQKYYIVSDHLGSPRVITDNNGNIIKTMSYDSFGNTLSDSNPIFTIPFGFAGGLYDVDTGLIRFGYRDYDSEAGRWTARDPIGLKGGDGNIYAYVGGDPLSYVDPTGESQLIINGGRMLFIPAPGARVLGGALIFAGLGQAAWQICGSGSGGSDGEESSAEDKKLSDAEAQKLKDAGFDPHDLKPKKGGSKFDLFKNKNGDIFVKPKKGNGPGDPTGLNINNY